MKNLINWEETTIDNIYNQLETVIEEQKSIEYAEAVMDGNPEEVLNVESYYDMYDEKLHVVKEVLKLDDEKKKDYLTTLFNIDNNKEIDARQKMMMMLSYGVLESYISDMVEKSQAEKNMISGSLSVIDVDDYNFYYPVIGDKRVSSKIVEKTSNLFEQISIGQTVMDSQDDYELDQIDIKDYENLVKSGLKIVDEYQLNSKTK